MTPTHAIYEARHILIGLGILWLLSLLLFPIFSFFLAIAFLYTVYFFRDPERSAPDDPHIAIAPADGKVVAIEEIEEPDFLKRKMKRVAIFLSVFDVHVNRSPIAGEVTHSEPRAGSYLDARNPESSTKNAMRLWVIRGEKCEVAVRQISGAIARRIVPWSRVGDKLTRSERFGMIRFGSRTELYIPLDSEVLVKIGDKVKSGETPLARLTLT